MNSGFNASCREHLTLFSFFFKYSFKTKRGYGKENTENNLERLGEKKTGILGGQPVVFSSRKIQRWREEGWKNDMRCKTAGLLGWTALSQCDLCFPLVLALTFNPSHSSRHWCWPWAQLGHRGQVGDHWTKHDVNSLKRHEVREWNHYSATRESNRSINQITIITIFYM